MLAVGSNAAPTQLTRKFATFAGDREVVAVACELRDHDVVYAARVSTYGAVPATVARCHAVTVTVKALLLDDAQLARLDETEGVGRAYDRVVLNADLVQVDGRPLRLAVPAAGRPSCYVARRGPALCGGAPVALSAVPAAGRVWRDLDEETMLRCTARATELDIPGFVERAIGDRVFRQWVSHLLAAGLPAPGHR